MTQNIPVEPLIVLLAGWASGISIYLAIALLGLCGHLGWIHLPGQMEIFSNPIIFTLAFVIFAIEFIADKVPYVDSVWDSVHTFIRPAGAILIGYLAGSEHGPLIQTAYALLAGTLTLTMHTAKATSRLAINSSPEPFTNIAASTAEQSMVIFMFWFFIQHPILASLLIVAILILAFFLIRVLWRFAKKIFTKRTASTSNGPF
jgi:hypothetical protein